MFFNGADIPDYDFSQPLPKHGIDIIVDLLLHSPIQKILVEYQATINTVHKYMGYLNWFLPIGWIIDTMSAILLAVGVYYGVMALLRWIKLIGS